MVVRDDGLEVNSKMISEKKKKDCINAFKHMLIYSCHFKYNSDQHHPDCTVKNRMSEIIPCAHEHCLIFTEVHV